ncbi:hypothetical protein ILT44_17225 [Microvirga sp. BT689]|uniref:hypothetical protein n=1 Tax=Microvirga arvi TaxID=2778731 RepID=UPI00194FA9D6|nr:hypothetical protein [Microvirga arvi]MBM6581943.1 hypothetical protein [Microvirga arvi]
MAELHLTDEILMAFADGELDESVAAAVAQVMAQDPSVARRIVDFQQSRRLSRSAFESSLSSKVPIELQAAISARIEAHEGVNSAGKVDLHEVRRTRLIRSFPLMRMALAACLAGIAVATGYFFGRQVDREASQIAQLEDPLIRRELSRLESGRDLELPMGRFRVISSYQLANGALCREFELKSASRSAGAVACRANEWNVTFAVSNPAKSADYTPSSGGDLMDSYLQNLGAGQPLEEKAEARALAEFMP